MKVFKIWASSATYDEYKSIVVVAEDEKRALNIAESGQLYDWKEPEKFDVYWYFDKEQFPLNVAEVKLDTESVLVSELIGS